jgi:hypothetical protein
MSAATRGSRPSWTPHPPSPLERRTPPPGRRIEAEYAKSHTSEPVPGLHIPAMPTGSPVNPIAVFRCCPSGVDGAGEEAGLVLGGEVVYDPFSVEAMADPLPFYAELRGLGVRIVSSAITSGRSRALETYVIPLPTSIASRSSRDRFSRKRLSPGASRWGAAAATPRSHAGICFAGSTRPAARAKFSAPRCPRRGRSRCWSRPSAS